jgi:hypothetical protein
MEYFLTKKNLKRKCQTAAAAAATAAAASYFIFLTSFSSCSKLPIEASSKLKRTRFVKTEI